jgi:hypothetical protein
MTKEDAAAQLNGCQYGSEGTNALFKAMKAAGLVAVYGASDDLVYFAGAEDDELGASERKVHLFTPAGLLRNACENDDCPYHAKLKKAAVPIKTVWDRDGISWQYETTIPHVTFDVMEDDCVYCRGIVFALADVPAAA